LVEIDVVGIGKNGRRFPVHGSGGFYIDAGVPGVSLQASKFLYAVPFEESLGSDIFKDLRTYTFMEGDQTMVKVTGALAVPGVRSSQVTRILLAGVKDKEQVFEAPCGYTVAKETAGIAAYAWTCAVSCDVGSGGMLTLLLMVDYGGDVELVPGECLTYCLDYPGRESVLGEQWPIRRRRILDWLAE